MGACRAGRGQSTRHRHCLGAASGRVGLLVVMTVLSVASVSAGQAMAATSASVAANPTPPCTVGQVGITQSAGSPAMGHFSRIIVVTNSGGHACDLTGFPTVGILTSSGERAATAVQDNSGVGLPASRSSVRLDPGEAASAQLGGNDMPFGQATSCPSYAADAVSLPGSTASKVFTSPLADCTGFSVTSFVPGFNGSAPSGLVIGRAPACGRSARGSFGDAGPFVVVNAWSGRRITGSTTVVASPQGTRPFRLILAPGRYRIGATSSTARVVTVRAGRIDDLGRYGVCVFTATTASTIPGRGGSATTSTSTSTSKSTTSTTMTSVPGSGSTAGFAPAGASFVNVDDGWVLGQDGCAACAAVLQTTDAGETWTSLPRPPVLLGLANESASSVTDVYFANSLIGFLYGPGLESTDNGGQTWTPTLLPPVVQLSGGTGDVYALTGSPNHDVTSLWRRTVDSAAWQSLPLPAHGALALAVEGDTLVLLQAGFAAGGPSADPGRLWTSQDDGAQWSARTVPCRPVDGAARLVSIAPGHPDSWLVDCYNGEQSSQELETSQTLYGTATAGQTWVLLGTPARTGYPALLADNGTGTAVITTESGAGDHLLASSDGGLQWSTVFASGGSDGGWADLEFLTPSTGYVVGPTRNAPGHLYRTEDGGQTWQILALAPG
jgi:Protein of unknown function (DUF4232)